jgi:lipoprotein-releasing system permease protein
MFHPAAVFIGLRYTRAKRRTHFISFISLTSLLGVALGVAALITVMSVMNGFQLELRSRILGMTAHATIVEQGGWLRDWQRFVAEAEQQPQVLGAAPFIRREAMVMHRGNVSGIVVNGVLPDQEPKVSEVGDKMIDGTLDTLRASAYNIVIGRELAAALAAAVGDQITVIAPQVNTTPAGVLPRQRRFTVTGIFEIGMNEYDSALALIHLDDAATLFRAPDGVSGVRLRLEDMFDAPAISAQVVRALNAGGLEGSYGVIPWTAYHSNFFTALKTEKVVMFVILALIVAVAAFNIVSTLVMVVTDKRAEVAILRTIGMRRRGIMLVFIVQGVLIGSAGILLGVVGGVALAMNVEAIVQYLEQTLHTRFLPADIYYISVLPSQLDWYDVFRVTGMAFLLTLLATLYPAWHAARTEPAEALRYE